MSFNRSPMAFDDIRDIFNRALESPKGIRISCNDRAQAFKLRSRFNYFRALDRRENKVLYAEDHVMYGRTPYDKLELRIPPRGTPEEHVLYIELRLASRWDVQEIT